MGAPPATPTWRLRVAELLDDPVGQAILRRDRLSRDDVLAAMAAAAAHVNRRPAEPAAA